MNDITERDIENMIEADREAREELERMTPSERLLEAFKLQQRALDGMCKVISDFVDIDNQIKAKRVE